MQCQACEQLTVKNTWTCPSCNAPLRGGVVFISGVSGSATDDTLRGVVQRARSELHEHQVVVHDVGEIMHGFATTNDPYLQWDRILDADPRALRYLRALAFQQIGFQVQSNPNVLHLLDTHLCFRWNANLAKGFEAHLLEAFQPYVRCFINIIEDLHKIQERLAQTVWGTRKILELLVWRDEELFLTDLYADICGPVESFAVAKGEPPDVIERLIWHPEVKRVYLSFPITNLRDDETANRQITEFRDSIRHFLVVFDPFACRDYDETYTREEMGALRQQVGEATVDRDFRFIDQADAVVVYFPKKVPSKGVDAEMNHARNTGKPIFLYSPEELGGGPFAVPPSHYRSDPQEFLDLLRTELDMGPDAEEGKQEDDGAGDNGSGGCDPSHNAGPIVRDEGVPE